MWLQELRKNLGQTQLEVAEKLGIHRASFSKIETGESLPSVRLAKAIGQLFNFDWTRFFNNDCDGFVNQNGDKNDRDINY